jgi:hypothetical protein
MKKLYGRGSNWEKMTTGKLTEILSHPHCQGSDGKDYMPYKEELQSELWRRQAVQDEKNIKRWDIEFKAQLKAETSAKGKSA